MDRRDCKHATRAHLNGVTGAHVSNDFLLNMGADFFFHLLAITKRKAINRPAATLITKYKKTLMWWFLSC